MLAEILRVQQTIIVMSAEGLLKLLSICVCFYTAIVMTMDNFTNPISVFFSRYKLQCHVFDWFSLAFCRILVQFYHCLDILLR